MKKTTILYLLFFFIACQQNKEAVPLSATTKQKEITNVKVTKTTLSKQAPLLHVSGFLGIKETSQLGFKIGGVIANIHVREGNFVKKGQLLAQLEKEEINAQVAQANSALTKAKRDLQRAENLYADTVATIEQVQDAEIGKEIWDSRLKIAEFNQKYAEIYAPANGKILKRLADPQEIIAPGHPVFVLSVAQDSKVMRVGLGDKDVVKIKVGDSANIKFDAYPNEIFMAKIAEIPELPDTKTATYPVELAVQSKGKILKAGFFGKVEIQPVNTTEYYKIPIEALVEIRDKTAFIFVPQNDIAKKVALQIQRIETDYFTVLAHENLNLKKVIIDGAAYLRDGEDIKILE